MGYFLDRAANGLRSLAGFCARHGRHRPVGEPSLLALSQIKRLPFTVGKKSSGGSDCQRQSVCRRHKRQQFQLSSSARVCLFMKAEIAASCGLRPPRCLRHRGYPGFFINRTLRSLPVSQMQFVAIEEGDDIRRFNASEIWFPIPWSNGTTPARHAGNDGSIPSGITYCERKTPCNVRGGHRLEA